MAHAPQDPRRMSPLSGLIFAVTAQSALTGALSPLRLAISEWWTIDGDGARDLIARTGIGHGGALVFALLWLVAGATVFVGSGSGAVLLQPNKVARQPASATCCRPLMAQPSHG